MLRLEKTKPEPAGADRLWCAMVALLSAAYLYARLFRQGTIPVLFQGDQVFFWSYGQRVLHGQVPYRDFFQITGPLTDWLFAADFWIFGERVAGANLFTLLLGVLLTTAVFLLARHFSTNALSALVAALYLVKIFGTFLSATHHFVSMAAIAVALLILLRGSSGRRCVVAGCACGFAALATQTHGLVAGAAIVLALLLERDIAFVSRLCKCALLVFGLLLVLLPPELLLGRSVGFARLWYYQVGLPSRWPGSGASSAWWLGRDPIAWAAVSLFLVYAFVPCVYALSAWRLFRSPQRQEDRLATLMLSVGTALAVEVWLAPNELRILALAVPSFALTGYLQREVRRRNASGAALALALLLVALSAWRSRREALTIVRIDHEFFAAQASEATKYQFLADHMRPGERVAEFAYPGVYLPLRQMNPLFADNLMPIPMVPPEIVDRAAEELEAQDFQWLIWNDALDALPSREAVTSFDHFHAFVSTHYIVVITLPNGEHILHRKDPSVVTTDLRSRTVWVSFLNLVAARFRGPYLHVASEGIPGDPQARAVLAA